MLEIVTDQDNTVRRKDKVKENIVSYKHWLLNKTYLTPIKFGPDLNLYPQLHSHLMKDFSICG